MSVDNAIEEGFKARLAALVLDPVLPVAWPNVAFTRPNTAGGVAPYLACSHMPASRTAFSIDVGANASDIRRGLFQVSVFWPVDQGETKAGEVADKVVAWFERGTDLGLNGTRVVVGATYRSGGVPDDVYYMIPVSVPWSAYT